MHSIDWRRETPRLIRDYAMVLIGALLTGASFTLFFLPHDIAPGGVTGLAEVLSSVSGIGVGLLSFFINLPLFLAGGRQTGWRFALRSFVAMSALSFFIDWLPVMDVAGELLLAAIFGGALMGLGLGLVVRGGATTGGTDMAAGLLRRLIPFIPMATIMLALDGLVIVVAAARFGLHAGLYALLSCFISSKAMDMVIKGFNTAMQFIIFTREPEAIKKRILFEMDRGCTELAATGGYSGKPVGALLAVVPRMEAARLKKIVAEVDPAAFMTVCDVNEVRGEGFTDGA